MMKRREFMAGLGCAVAWPVVARGQQVAMPAIGFLCGVSPGPFAQRLAAFHQGLEESGMIAGRNVAIEYRWAEDQYDRLPALAADLVGRGVAVIVAYPDAAALAAKAATTTIPTIFLSGSGPVRAGIVPRLNRPGESITGVSWFGVDLESKQLSLLHELVPDAIVVALLVDRNSADATTHVSDVETAARTLQLQLVALTVRTASDIDLAFSRLAPERVDALLVGAGAFLHSRRNQIIALAARYGIPTIYGFREYAVDGGFISYGNDIPDAFRRAGVYTGRILKGEKPADLPVERTTKFELIINLKTAKALGVELPSSLLARADEIIE